MTLSLRTPRLTGPDLAERRRDLEATQEEVARHLGVNRSRIATVEAMAAPSRGATRRYLEALAAIEAAR